MPRLSRRSRPGHKVRWIALAGLVVIAAFVGYSAVGAYRLEVEDVTIARTDVPPEFDGFTVLLITDVHAGPFFSRERVRDLVEEAEKLRPDVILLGGDFVSMSARYIEPCFVELSRLRAPLGVFGVLGNHDYWEDAPRVRSAMAAAGVTLLEDQARWLERGASRIRLGGVDDLQEGFPDVGPTLQGTTARDFVVLLSHNPDYAERLPGGAVDLMLSGHTHGGQLTFFGLWAPHIPSEYGQKYRTGVVTVGDATVVVSNGVGTTTVPLRFFAPPQIVVVRLESLPGPPAG